MKTIARYFSTLCASLAFALAWAPAHAQLISVNQATNATVTAIQGDLNLDWLTTDVASFTAGGILFEAIPNPFLGDFVVGTGELGLFYAEISFLGRESLRPNHFGVSSEGGGYLAADSITLFNDYTDADKPITRRLTAAEYTVADFWHYADKPGFTGSFYQDEALSFRWWSYTDTVNNLQYSLGGIDDLRTSVIDFDDGAFLIVTNTVGIAFEDSAVPEPSTYGLFGAAALLALVYFRKVRSSRR